MNKLRPESIPEAVIAGASALVLTSYLVRCKPGEPMPDATMKAIEYAKKHDVPVVLTLGTKYVIADNPAWWQEFLQEHVSILAMNEEEGEALTGFADPLSAANKALDWVDLVLCTAGPAGLYMAGFTEEEAKRKTQHPLLPGAIPEFNQFEFSRAMRHQDCVNPLRIYSHIAPYMGGPEKIMNTNGAGDGALAALLHDITANNYHRNNVPNSSKHKCKWLTYSSLAQVCKYANRVSYQVLNHLIGSAIDNVVHFVIIMGAGDNLDIRTFFPCGSDNLSGLVAVRDCQQQPAGAIEMRQLHDLFIGGIAEHRADPALA